MELLALLKRLNHIAPGREYTSWSRSVILSSKPAARRGVFSVILRSVGSSLEFGSAIVLTTLLLVLIGGISSWEPLSPLKLDSLDPTGLRAEAEAIDIQIQITNISYEEPLADAGSAAAESTAKIASPKSPALLQKAHEEALELGIPALAPASSENATIEETLDELSR